MAPEQSQLREEQNSFAARRGEQWQDQVSLQALVLSPAQTRRKPGKRGGVLSLTRMSLFWRGSAWMLDEMLVKGQWKGVQA